MSDLTQTDVVVSQGADDEDYTGQRYNRMMPSITFGNASLTYPTNGIPLPDIAKFRLKFLIKRLYFQQPVGSYEYVYDPTVRVGAPYGTIRIYARANGAEFSGAVAATTLLLDITGA